MELYPNTTQVPNVILDNTKELSGSELKVLLLIVRKTIGWHKETDWLTYSYIKNYTGLQSEAIRNALVFLIKNSYIKRLDKDGKEVPLKTKLVGEVKIYYTLSKTISRYFENRSKDTSKIEDYKTNYTKYSNNEKITPKNFNRIAVELQDELNKKKTDFDPSAPGYKKFKDKLKEFKNAKRK